MPLFKKKRPIDPNIMTPEMARLEELMNKRKMELQVEETLTGLKELRDRLQFLETRFAGLSDALVKKMSVETDILMKQFNRPEPSKPNEFDLLY